MHIYDDVPERHDISLSVNEVYLNVDPFVFRHVYQDYDRRIREATHQAFEQLVLKVRRSLAPFLKSLMGHWILSQCDTYTPAASAACQAFQAAFTPAKQPEALSFCKDEILNVRSCCGGQGDIHCNQRD